MLAAMRRASQIGRSVPSGLGLEIHVSQRLSVVVADDETTAVCSSMSQGGGNGVARLWPRQPAEWPEQHNNKDHGDHSQGEGNRHNGLSAHLASQYCGRCTSSGSLAILAAMRWASSRVSRLEAGIPCEMFKIVDMLAT